MDDCCAPRVPGDFDGEFTARYAGGLARRYRRRGLTPSARLVLDVADSIGLDGASLLEIGGGVGEIQLEALRRGAAHATNLELSHAYESEAARLLDEAGLRARVSRVLDVDLALTPDAVAMADIVVLHRVVCCYPDADRLLTAAAEHGRQAVIFSHPPRNAMTRLILALSNAVNALTGNTYRAFAHAPDAMIDVLRRHGFEPCYLGRRGSWHVVGAVHAQKSAARTRG